MASKKHLKQPAIKAGTHLKLPPSLQAMQEIDYPIFCLKYLDRDHHLLQCSNDEKAALANKMFQLSQMSWNAIQLSGRHGNGSEKIARNAIRRPIPAFISGDVDHLLAIRFDGLKPMVGHRSGAIFHILFLDRDFTLYAH